MKFKAGKTYTARSIGDYDCVFTAEIISRTAKTAIIKAQGQTKRVKIRHYDGVETMFALGQYSMAPCFRADREVAQ